VETSVSELAPSLKPALRRARVCESIERMELGVHLPLMGFGDEGQSLGRLQATVDAAGRSGFVAVSANDHFVFSTPWLGGLTALAAVIDRSGEMTLATTISPAALRGPVPLAKALAALDVLSDGRLVAGVGPGSSERDYDAVGIPFDDRWKRFDEAVRILGELSNVVDSAMKNDQAATLSSVIP
jgi:alkanesulfonate monooxygenase SsuD/methylene tetrahydromethanopterin reductase-like flavin-dependent oxidoreductase (luciferase family)